MIGHSPLHHEHQPEAVAAALEAMQAQLQPEGPQAAEQQAGILRRTVVKDAGLIAVVAALPSPGVPDWARVAAKYVAETGGEIYDDIIGTERILPGPALSLAPRRDNTPSVSPKIRGEPVSTWTSFSPQENKRTLLRFASDISAEAEHFPHQDLKLDEGVFAESGVAILTTAEGLTGGEQVHARMFKDQKTGQLIAVGLGKDGEKGGLYIYKTELGKAGVTGGEWVRIVTRPDKNAPPSAMVSAKTWAEMQAFMPKRFFAQDQELGKRTLRQAGYKPFGAILPTTKTPDTKTITLSPENCLKDASELTRASRKEFWITEKGDLIGLSHVVDKAEETLRLTTELIYQIVTGAKNPTARIKYAKGFSGHYEFAIDPSALKLENVVDMTASIMDTVTTLMEGVTQRTVFEFSPALQDEIPFGHFNPEDAFTNKLVGTEMQAVMQEMGITQELTTRMQVRYHQNPRLSEKDMGAVVDDLLRDIQPRLVRIVIDRLATKLGVREQTTTVTREMPLNPYHEMSVKADPEDAAHPTYIDTLAAGINPDNTEAHRFRAVNVPILEVVGSQVVRKLTR